jgi:hypothetical protein
MENCWDNTGPTEMDRDGRLNLAEALLVQVRATLSEVVITCPTCGTDHKENWDEFMAGQALDAAITRIKKASALLNLSIGKRLYGVTTGTELKAAKRSRKEPSP